MQWSVVIGEWQKLFEKAQEKWKQGFSWVRLTWAKANHLGNREAWTYFVEYIQSIIKHPLQHCADILSISIWPLDLTKSVKCKKIKLMYMLSFYTELITELFIMNIRFGFGSLLIILVSFSRFLRETEPDIMQLYF